MQKKAKKDQMYDKAMNFQQAEKIRMKERDLR